VDVHELGEEAELVGDIVVGDCSCHGTKLRDLLWTLRLGVWEWLTGRTEDGDEFPDCDDGVRGVAGVSGQAEGEG